MQSISSKRFIIGVLLVWSVLMAIFSFADLSLSQAVYNEAHSLFGLFFENLGEHPAYIVIFAAGNILFSTARYEPLGKKIFIRFVSGFLLTIGGFGAFVIGISRLSDSEGNNYMLLSLLLTIALTVLTQWLLQLVPRETLKAYNLAAWAGIAIIFSEIILVNVLKIFWGRLRFREMNGDYSQFTRWYMPQGIQHNGVTSEAYKSFPSGHSANGWSMLVWMLFMPVATKWRNLMFFLAVIWGLCTSYSRIVMGAHFATDVLFGAFITICCMLLWCKIFKIELYPNLTALHTQSTSNSKIDV